MAQRTWRVVAPVKGGSDAKSRLGPPGEGRTSLARAIALDCVAAAVACRPAVDRVLVVTPDPLVARAAGRAGAAAVRQRREGAGLLGAVRDGLRAAGRGPVAVLLADLPCLRPADLDAALAAAAEALDGGAGSAFVPDAEGSGTVLLAALEPGRLTPAFGTESAAAHERGGARRLDLDLPRLRRDVDTPQALAEAVALGIGPRSASVLRARQATSA